MSTTLEQLETLPAAVQQHAAQIADLHSLLSAHEAAIAAMTEKWNALSVAVNPAVTRPLMAIPKA